MSKIIQRAKGLAKTKKGKYKKCFLKQESIKNYPLLGIIGVHGVDNYGHLKCQFLFNRHFKTKPS